MGDDVTNIGLKEDSRLPPRKAAIGGNVRYGTQIPFGDPEPEKLEAVKSPLLERFAKSKGILILKDEAHHVWDEPGHIAFEEKAKQKATTTEEEAEAMAWISAIRKLNRSENAPGCVGLQIDLLATLFQETGTTTQTKQKTRKGQGLGHSDIKHAARYSELSAKPFHDSWR